MGITMKNQSVNTIIIPLDKNRLLVKPITSKNPEWIKNSKLKWDNYHNGWIVSNDTTFDIVNIHLNTIDNKCADTHVDIEPLVITKDFKNNTSRKVEKKKSLPFTNMIYHKHGGGYL